eukprot:5258999-Amphidinium_carterae.1
MHWSEDLAAACVCTHNACEGILVVEHAPVIESSSDAEALAEHPEPSPQSLEQCHLLWPLVQSSLLWFGCFVTMHRKELSDK